MVYNSKISNNYKLLREIRDILKNGEYGTGGTGDNTELLSKLDELEARLDNLVDNDTIYDDTVIRNEINALKAELLRDKLTYVAYSDNLRLNDNNGAIGHGNCYTDEGFVRQNDLSYDDLISIYNPKDLNEPYYLEWYGEYKTTNTDYLASPYNGMGLSVGKLSAGGTSRINIDNLPLKGKFGLLFETGSISLFVDDEYVASVNGEYEFTNYDKLGIGYECTLIRDFKVYTYPVNNNTPSESNEVIFNPNEYYSCPNPNMKLVFNIVDENDNPITGQYFLRNSNSEYNYYPIIDGVATVHIRKPIYLGENYESAEFGGEFISDSFPTENNNKEEFCLFRYDGKWVIDMRDVVSGNVGEVDSGYGYVIGDEIPDELIINVKIGSGGE